MWFTNEGLFARQSIYIDTDILIIVHYGIRIQRDGKYNWLLFKVHQKFTDMASNSIHVLPLIICWIFLKMLKEKRVFLTIKCFRGRTYAAGKKMDFRIRWTWVQILIQLRMILDSYFTSLRLSLLILKMGTIITKTLEN